MNTQDQYVKSPANTIPTKPIIKSFTAPPFDSQPPSSLTPSLCCPRSPSHCSRIPLVAGGRGRPGCRAPFFAGAQPKYTVPTDRICQCAPRDYTDAGAAAAHDSNPRKMRRSSIRARIRPAAPFGRFHVAGRGPPKMRVFRLDLSYARPKFCPIRPGRGRAPTLARCAANRGCRRGNANRQPLAATGRSRRGRGRFGPVRSSAGAAAGSAPAAAGPPLLIRTLGRFVRAAARPWRATESAPSTAQTPGRRTGAAVTARGSRTKCRDTARRRA